MVLPQLFLRKRAPDFKLFCAYKISCFESRGNISHNDNNNNNNITIVIIIIILIIINTEIQELDQEGVYKYLGVDESDGIQHSKMKEKIRKEYNRRVRLILRTELNGRNKIEAINSLAVPVNDAKAILHNWKISELKKIDTKTLEPPGSSTVISSLMRMGPLLLISHVDLLEVKYHSALEDP